MLSPSMRHTSTSLLPYHPLHSPAPSSDLNTSSSSPSTSASSSKSELTLTVTTMHPPTPHTIDCPGHCIIPCSDPSCWTTLNPKTSGVEEECTGECRIIECDESVCGGDFDEGCDDLHCHAQDCDGSIGCDVNDGWHNWHCDTGECTTTDYTQMVCAPLSFFPGLIDHDVSSFLSYAQLDCCQSAKTLIGLGASSSSSFQNVTQMSNATSSEIDAFLNDYSFAHLDSIFPSHQHLPSTHIPYSKPLDYTYNPPTSSSSHLPLPFACQWSGCKHSFSSMPELVGHVNLAHLRLSSSSPPTTPSSLSTSSANSNAEPLSCLWADCHIHPSLLSLPPTSQTQTSEADLYALAAHLLHDHLGLSPPSQPPTPALTLYSSSPRPSTSASASSSPSSIVIQESGSCKCKWSNCGLCFNNVEELTNHISEKHVGSGKNAYECFWEGCTRNGTKYVGAMYSRYDRLINNGLQLFN
jgi:hypothetical protein